MSSCRPLLRVFVAAVLVSFAPVVTRAQDAQLFQGDWVGEIRVADATTFVRAHFEKDSVGPVAVLDMPTTKSWGVQARLATGAGNPLRFQFPFASDTAYFEGNNTASSIDGRVRLGTKEGNLHLVHRLAYDSAFVRSIAGNYEIAPNHVISMGPLDEAGGWLAFFDNKTLRTGILYALTDSTFFSGPSYGIDYPISIRASVHRDAAGRIDGLVWREGPDAGRGMRDESERLARRVNDFRVDKNVSFTNAGVRLVGDLSLPNTAGRHPAVILIHGCCGSKPTRDFGYWSSYLAHHGIAVLAYDRRGG